MNRCYYEIYICKNYVKCPWCWGGERGGEARNIKSHPSSLRDAVKKIYEIIWVFSQHGGVGGFPIHKTFYTKNSP